MLCAKIGWNWCSSFREEAEKKLEMFKCFAPPWGQNLNPRDNEKHNFGRGLPALHHHAFSFSSTCAVVEKKIFGNWSNLSSFCPALKAPGGQGSWNSQFLLIHNFCSPSPIDGLCQNWLKLVQRFQRSWQEVRSVQMFCPALGAKPLPQR